MNTCHLTGLYSTNLVTCTAQRIDDNNNVVSEIEMEVCSNLAAAITNAEPEGLTDLNLLAYNKFDRWLVAHG